MGNYILRVQRYLEDLLIQKPGAKHGDAFGVNDGALAPREGLGDLLLTVHDDGDRLLLHTDGNAVPPGQGHNKEGKSESKGESSVVVFKKSI